MRMFISDGIDGITFQYKGGNRAFHKDFKQQVLTVCSRSEYHGFGPTFASEKLKELENLNTNRETLRQWMIKQGCWKGRSRKKARIHQSRERRPQFGELVQIDGSHHDWFGTLKYQKKIIMSLSVGKDTNLKQSKIKKKQQVQ
jgi:hypothetical protein